MVEQPHAVLGLVDRDLTPLNDTRQIARAHPRRSILGKVLTSIYYLQTSTIRWISVFITANN